MHTLPTGAGDRNGTSEWWPWDPDALTALTRGRTICVEPAPWLVPAQARRLHDLIDDLMTYQCVHRLQPQIPNGHLAVQSQAREIATRLAELANVGVQVDWRPGTDGTAIHLLCRR